MEQFSNPIAGMEDTPLARDLANNTKRLSAIAAATVKAPAHTRIFTISNQKGGVGKTTTAVNLAASLAQKGLKVLVIDLDPQGNASTALGVDHHGDVRGIYEVLTEGAALASVIRKSTVLDNLYCVPATLDLAGAEMEMISNLSEGERNHVLRNAISAFMQTAAVKPDYIFIDCPPSLGLLTINAFTAAKEVLIPIQCEYYALEGLSQLLRNIQLIQKHLNPSLELTTILLTMFDNRTKLAGQVADDVREHFPQQTLETVIPRSVRVAEAPSFQQPVITYDKTSPGTIAYLEAAIELANRGA